MHVCCGVKRRDTTSVCSARSNSHRRRQGAVAMETRRSDRQQSLLGRSLMFRYQQGITHREERTKNHTPLFLGEGALPFTHTHTHKAGRGSPMSSLFLTSRAMFLRAVATAHTTRSLSILSSSTRMGRPFSLRTAARMYTDH